jgi:hypothetical protein
VHADHPLGRQPAHDRSHEGSDVAALDAVPVVAQPCHQLDERARDTPVDPARVAEWAGEAEAEQRGDHQVEGVARVAAVGPGVGEGADQLQELHDRPRPAVEQQQRGGVRFGGADMEEVHGGPVDGGPELGMLVELGLVLAPVVAPPPVVGQLLEVSRGTPRVQPTLGSSSGQRVRASRWWRSSRSAWGTSTRKGRRSAPVEPVSVRPVAAGPVVVGPVAVGPVAVMGASSTVEQTVLFHHNRTE